MVARREPPLACVAASLIAHAVAVGNSDHRRAIAPVTKGAAALVPLKVLGLPSDPRLVTPSPGALNPRRPIEPPKLDSLSVLPCELQAATGMTHGWRVIAELPTVP